MAYLCTKDDVFVIRLARDNQCLIFFKSFLYSSCDLKSMLKWKVPLKYRGMRLTLSGPLWYWRAMDWGTPWSVCKVPYKRGEEVSTSSTHVGINTAVFGCPHYPPPPHPHFLLLETSSQPCLLGPSMVQLVKGWLLESLGSGCFQNPWWGVETPHGSTQSTWA
jgi:hypothetical protein